MEEKRHILVNKENAYNPDDYKDLEYETIAIRVFNDNEIVDGDVVHVDENGRKWVDTYIEKNTLEAFKKLQASIKEKYGFELEIIEAGRTLEKQNRYYENASKKSVEYAENYVAKPGYSEHHTGRAFDYSIRNPKISSIRNGFVKKCVYKLSKPVMFSMVNNEASKLGLVVRYPLLGRKFTGYKHERWHLTNIGDPALASYLRTRNMPLEKFYEKEDKYADKFDSYKEKFYSNHPEIARDDAQDGMDK